MDLVDIESGNRSFGQAIIDGIEQSKVFLFMRSENSQKSKYAMLELNYAYESPNLHVVIINIDNSPMNKVFRFHFSLVDTIAWNDSAQRKKLIKDLRRWTDKYKENVVEFPKQKVEEEPNQKLEEKAPKHNYEKDAEKF